VVVACALNDTYARPYSDILFTDFARKYRGNGGSLGQAAGLSPFCTRTTGNGGGTFLLAGPNWKGETPKGIDKVFRSETELVFPGYRTQLFNPSYIDNVKKAQAGYKVQTLSSFLGQPAPPAAPAIDFIKPLTPDEERTSLEFFNVLNFVLQFCPTDPSETELMARFPKIGVGAGKTFDPSKLTP
jgi:hypothetical protein